MVSAPKQRITEIDITPGTNLTVRIPSAEDPAKMIDVFSSYELTIDENTFLVTAPMKGTLLYPIRSGERVEVAYVTNKAAFECPAIVGDRLKKGNLNFLTMHCDGHIKRNQRRGDFRVDIFLETTTLKALKANPTLVLPDAQPVKCLINNLSAGGAAVYTNEQAEVGEAIHINMPAMIFGEQKKLMAQVHWVRRTNIEDVVYKYYMGIRFIFNNPVDKEELIKFTLEHQRQQLRKGRE